ncbi:MAG: DUF4956 domain-containing protein [Gemmatimonadota bacterium]
MSLFHRPPDRENRASLIRLALYYALLVVVLVVLARTAPTVWTSSSLERLRGAGPFDSGATATEPIDLFVVFISVAAALLIMLPVAWTYIIIKRRGDYDQSVVHTLIILPVAVTGIVLIVQHSLALAFSLAGIVAAVRFRTTLKDVKDGVYVFLAIGVGLACGVQAIGVAAVVSVLFNGINLLLWAQDFGNIYADSARRTKSLNLGEALAGPGSEQSAVSIGDRRLLEALSPRDLKDVAERRARMERHLDDETGSRKEKRRYSVLIVHAQWVAMAQKVVDTNLARMAFRWRLAEIVPADASTSVLEYLVRLKEEHTPGELLDCIRQEGGRHILAAEIRALSGLRARNSSPPEEGD